MPRAQACIEAFRARERRDGASAPQRKRLADAREDAVPAFLNGRALRDYQRESLKWMVGNMRRGQNCILGDEMVRAAPALAVPGTP